MGFLSSHCIENGPTTSVRSADGTTNLRPQKNSNLTGGTNITIATSDVKSAVLCVVLYCSDRVARITFLQQKTVPLPRQAVISGAMV